MCIVLEGRDKLSLKVLISLKFYVLFAWIPKLKFKGGTLWCLCSPSLLASHALAFERVSGLLRYAFGTCMIRWLARLFDGRSKGLVRDVMLVLMIAVLWSAVWLPWLVAAGVFHL